MALFAKQIIDFDISDRTAPFQDAASTLGSPWHFPRLKQGDTMVLYVDLFLENGDPANLTSAFTFAAQFRSRDRSPRIEGTATVTIVSAQRIEIRLEASEASNMQAERGNWDVEVEYDDGGAENHKDTFIEGAYGLDLEVTR